MLLAARTGRWPLTGLDLSSRCWIRRWFRLRRRRRMAFTRNPFLLALMLCGYFIKHRRNQRISSFLKKRRAKPDGFAYLRASDAAHVSVAAVHAVDYLLTWNCKHLANAQIARKIALVCTQAGHRMPIICTPEELM